MTLPLAALLGGLLLVAFVHTRSRLLGAIGAAAWSVAAAVYGVFQFQTRETLEFLGISTRPWVYYAFMAGLFTFNCAMIVRMLRLKNAGSAAAGRAPR